jgi:hypothetical protein
LVGGERSSGQGEWPGALLDGRLVDGKSSVFNFFGCPILNVANMPRGRPICCEQPPNQWSGTFCHPTVMPEK